MTIRTGDILLRDPFVLKEGDQYYLYGTRSKTAFTKQADGFDVYVSRDLRRWEKPVECFQRPPQFWGTRNFWAPEVYAYAGAYYMFATFADDKKRLGTAVLRASSPLGPFIPWSQGTITPEEWRCLDGSLYMEQGQPYMIFSREWKQVHDGAIYAVALSDDLCHAKGEPFLLFHASLGRPLVKPFLFRNYVTDGPFPFRTGDGVLHLLWSSFGKGGYMQLIAHSSDNTLKGNWKIEQVPLYHNDGGHGMIFTDYAGELVLALHTPNTFLKEHPVLKRVDYVHSALQIKEE